MNKQACNEGVLRARVLDHRTSLLNDCATTARSPTSRIATCARAERWRPRPRDPPNRSPCVRRCRASPVSMCRGPRPKSGGTTTLGDLPTPCPPSSNMRKAARAQHSRPRLRLPRKTGAEKPRPNGLRPYPGGKLCRERAILAHRRTGPQLQGHDPHTRRAARRINPRSRGANDAAEQA